MTTMAQHERTRRDLEEQIGIDPIEVLQADRRALYPDALYGSKAEALAAGENALYLEELPPAKPGLPPMYRRKGLASLRARYGPGGTADARRKSDRAVVENRIAIDERSKTVTFKKVVAGKLVEHEGVPNEITETEIGRLAAGDPTVRAALDWYEIERTLYLELELQERELTELIERDSSLIYYATREPR